MRTVLFPTLIALVLCVTTVTTAEKIRVIGFNVEAGYKSDADSRTIAQQVKDRSPADLWGFSEVTAKRWPEQLTKAAGQNFKMELGSTATDRLLAIYNADKFTLMRRYELKYLQFGRGGRPPLVLHLRLKVNSPDSTDFLFVVNHLHRTADGKRSFQARGLNLWAPFATNAKSRTLL